MSHRARDQLLCLLAAEEGRVPVIPGVAQRNPIVERLNLQVRDGSVDVLPLFRQLRLRRVRPGVQNDRLGKGAQIPVRKLRDRIAQVLQGERKGLAARVHALGQGEGLDLRVPCHRFPEDQLARQALRLRGPVRHRAVLRQEERL